MFYKKPGSPTENDIVLCTIKRITYNSIFVTLDEYKKIDGMIHISEIAPGRIRNIRDHVKEGKKVVCKVLRVYRDKTYLELSLRRVNNAQKINKNAEYKNEQRAEKILELAAKNINKSLKDMYDEFGYELLNKYELLYPGLQKISEEHTKIKEYKLNKKTEESLIKVIKEKIKPVEVSVSAILNLENKGPEGIEIIKKILLKIKKKGIKIIYLSAPQYKITITSKDYKTAENILKDICENAIELIKTEDGTGEYKKIK